MTEFGATIRNGMIPPAVHSHTPRLPSLHCLHSCARGSVLPIPCVPPAPYRPPICVPRPQGYADDLDFHIERPIRQHATGSRGLYRGLYIEEKPMSLAQQFKPQVGPLVITNEL